MYVENEWGGEFAENASTPRYAYIDIHRLSNLGITVYSCTFTHKIYSNVIFVCIAKNIIIAFKLYN